MRKRSVPFHHPEMCATVVSNDYINEQHEHIPFFEKDRYAEATAAVLLPVIKFLKYTGCPVKRGIHTRGKNRRDL